MVDFSLSWSVSAGDRREIWVRNEGGNGRSWCLSKALYMMFYLHEEGHVWMMNGLSWLLRQ